MLAEGARPTWGCVCGGILACQYVLPPSIGLLARETCCFAVHAHKPQQHCTYVAQESSDQQGPWDLF